MLRSLLNLDGEDWRAVASSALRPHYCGLRLGVQASSTPCSCCRIPSTLATNKGVESDATVQLCDGSSGGLNMVFVDPLELSIVQSIGTVVRVILPEGHRHGTWSCSRHMALVMRVCPFPVVMMRTAGTVCGGMKTSPDMRFELGGGLSFSAVRCAVAVRCKFGFWSSFAKSCSL